MLKLLATLALSITMAGSMLACCAAEPHTLTELLLNDTKNRVIFRCRVIESSAGLRGDLYSTVVVEEVFKGLIRQKKVVIGTGLVNSSAGGHSLKPGSEWLIFGHPREFGIYAALVCDPFSCEKDEDSERFQPRLQLLRSYRDAVKTGYSGAIKWMYDAQTIAAEGSFKNGRPHGNWRHFFHDGKFRSEATFKDGILHGIETKVLEHHQGREITTFENGKRVFIRSEQPTNKRMQVHESTYLEEKEGIQKIHHKSWHPNGKVYMEYTRLEPTQESRVWNREGCYDGAFFEQDSNGTMLNKGEYLLGAKINEWVHTPYRSNNTTTQFYPTPVMPSAQFFRFSDKGNVVVSGNMKDGLPEGVWYYYSEEGKPYLVSNFLSGKLHGEVVHYMSRTGRIWLKENYKNGVKHGLETHFDETGAWVSRQSYKNGLLDGESISRRTKADWSVKSWYKKGRLHGQYMERDQNDQLKFTVNMVDGKPEGMAEEYERERNSCTRMIGEYHNGFRVGEWQVYDCDGKLLKKCDMGKPGEIRTRRTRVDYFAGNCSSTD